MKSMKLFALSVVVATSILFGACHGSSSSNGPTPVGPPVTFTATPMTVVASGSSLLSWSAIESSTCQASGGWSGPKATKASSESVGPLMASTTYLLTCTGSNGASTTVSVTVTVTTAPGVCSDPLAKNNGQVGTCDYTYYSPEGVFSASDGLHQVPATSFSATLIGITPAPGSTLRSGQTATIDIVHAVASIAPVLDPAGYTVFYDWVDQAGNVVNNTFLGGGAGTYTVGSSAPKSKSTMVTGGLPTDLYGLRIRWAPGTSASHGFVLIPDPGSQLGTKLDPISVTVIVKWHFAG